MPAGHATPSQVDGRSAWCAGGFVARCSPAGELEIGIVPLEAAVNCCQDSCKIAEHETNTPKTQDASEAVRRIETDAAQAGHEAAAAIGPDEGAQR